MHLLPKEASANALIHNFVHTETFGICQSAGTAALCRSRTSCATHVKENEREEQEGMVPEPGNTSQASYMLRSLPVPFRQEEGDQARHDGEEQEEEATEAKGKKKGK